MDLTKIKRYSISKRESKVPKGSFAYPKKNYQIVNFIDSLPDMLAAGDFKNLLKTIVSASKKKKKIIFMMGAHPIKCGLSLYIIEMMKKGIITDIALNGAGIIHDFEIAYFGKTSEDVEKNLADGSFGMVEETGKIINNFLNYNKTDTGLGTILSKNIFQNKYKYNDLSILANAFKYKVQVTVHCAIGTDIIYQHPECRGELWGKESYNDFLLLSESVSKLDNGVVLCFGSAVIMPEVFLKAISVSRNLYKKPNTFTTAYFDMIKQYRPMMNIVTRPIKNTGKGYYFVGHHEIMLPLLASYLLEKL